MSHEAELEKLRAENERLSDIESDVLGAASDLGLYDGDDVQSAIDLLRNEVDYHHKWMWQAEGLLCIGSARPDDVMAKLTRLKAENARLREDSARLTWLSANLDIDENGQPSALLTSYAFQRVMLRCPPCGTEFPHLRAAIDAARKGEHDA